MQRRLDDPSLSERPVRQAAKHPRPDEGAAPPSIVAAAAAAAVEAGESGAAAVRVLQAEVPAACVLLLETWSEAADAQLTKAGLQNAEAFEFEK